MRVAVNTLWNFFDNNVDILADCTTINELSTLLIILNITVIQMLTIVM